MTDEVGCLFMRIFYLVSWGVGGSYLRTPAPDTVGTEPGLNNISSGSISYIFLKKGL